MRKENLVPSGMGALTALAALAAVGGVGLATGLAESTAYSALVILDLAVGASQEYMVLLALAAMIVAAALGFVATSAAARIPAALRVLWATALGVALGLAVVAGATAGWVLSTPDWREQVAERRWWLSDVTPPVVSIAVPSEPVRGLAPISITTTDEGRHSITSVTVSGYPITPVSQFTLDTSSLPDGEHTILVEVEDASRQRNRAVATAGFRSETRWWLTDVTPPTITLTVPAAVVHGAVTITLATADEGEHHVTRFTLNDAPLPVSDVVAIDTTKLPDGEHTIIVEAEDASYRRNRAHSKAVLFTDNTPPTITVRFDPPLATQGHVGVVRVGLSEPVSTITATLGGRPLTLARNQDDYWAVVGFAPDAEPGALLLAVRAVDAPGHSAQVTATMVITPLVFLVEHLRGEAIVLSPDRAALLAYAPSETVYLDAIFAPVTPEPLWRGLFAVPVKGRQTSPFAIRRSYDGGPLGSYHGGVDIAADAGVAVLAANRGRVVLAEPLKVRGNAVILDHGMGVYSAYYHLSEIRVQKGQMIEKGQIVGLVGDTGLSTGPHLHWEMRVTGAPVDPWPWTQRAIP